MKILLEVFGSETPLAGLQFFRWTGEDKLAAFGAAIGTQFQYPVSRSDNIEVVLHNENSIALVNERFEHLEQATARMLLGGASYSRIVGDRRAQIGEYVQPGTQLLTVVPMNASPGTAELSAVPSALKDHAFLVAESGRWDRLTRACGSVSKAIEARDDRALREAEAVMDRRGFLGRMAALFGTAVVAPKAAQPVGLIGGSFTRGGRADSPAGRLIADSQLFATQAQADDYKRSSRRDVALGFYGKQAEGLDAAGVASMRKSMEADFADGGIDGLDGEGWTSLNTQLKALEKNKTIEAAQAKSDLIQRGGFPPVHLSEINFQAMYEQQQAQAAATQQ